LLYLHLFSRRFSRSCCCDEDDHSQRVRRRAHPHSAVSFVRTVPHHSLTMLTRCSS
jgi:hypothetical protein